MGCRFSTPDLLKEALMAKLKLHDEYIIPVKSGHPDGRGWLKVIK